MGEAKRRGTFEERRRAAIDRDEQYRREHPPKPRLSADYRTAMNLWDALCGFGMLMSQRPRRAKPTTFFRVE